MKLLILLVIAAPLNVLRAQAVKSSVRTDLTCVERMTIPTDSRYQATAKVLFTVAADGAQTDISVQVRYPSDQNFAAWLRAELFDATFSKQCVGEIIEVNFTYILRSPQPTSPQSEIHLKNANTFEIVVRRPAEKGMP